MLYKKSHASFLTICFILFVSSSSRSSIIGVYAEEQTQQNETETKETQQEQPKKKEKVEFPEHKWGTYYDPQGIFCGKYDCYKILGFDFESWGRSPPSKKELTQSYRTMSKLWHPDKNKDVGAKDRFLKINKAYEVLTDKKQRKEYDHFRERPDEYFYKYGSPTIYHYAPKSDTVFVILLILLGLNGFAWFAQKQRWQQIANRVVKDAVEGLEIGKGGSDQSVELRKKAQVLLKEKKETDSNNSTTSTTTTKNGKKAKLTKKELKEKENEELRPFIEELVNEMTDFGAGFHQPTWRDLLILKMMHWPVYVAKGTMWQTKYTIRRLRKMELNEEERQVLTERAVGPIAWMSASDADREEMLGRELWNMENLELWLEDQEIKQLSKTEQKRIQKARKMEGRKKND